MEAVVEDKYLCVIASLGLKAGQQPGPRLSICGTTLGNLRWDLTLRLLGVDWGYSGLLGVELIASCINRGCTVCSNELVSKPLLNQILQLNTEFKENTIRNSSAMAMDGTASNKKPARNESGSRNRGRDHESMEVGVTAPERTPGDVSQASTASERPQRLTTVEARVGRGNYETVWVSPSWDRNKAFNHRILPRFAVAMKTKRHLLLLFTTSTHHCRRYRHHL